jgi:hypothetical protein
MLQGIVRLLIAWFAMCGVIGFWYWMFSRIGTFWRPDGVRP